MTVERHVPQDDDEPGFALALTLPLVARSDSRDSGRMPTDLATQLSTSDPEAASVAADSKVFKVTCEGGGGGGVG